MRLKHYTSVLHLPYILQSGSIKVCESNIGAPRGRIAHEGPAGPHAGPDVAWFTVGDYEGTAASPVPGSRPKDDVVFEVEVDDAHHWPEWARLQGINEQWYRILAEMGNPDEWYIVERPVPREQWQRVYLIQRVKVEGFARNAHCPCGSANKFKHCHLGSKYIEMAIQEIDTEREA